MMFAFREHRYTNRGITIREAYIQTEELQYHQARVVEQALSAVRNRMNQQKPHRLWAGVREEMRFQLDHD